MTNIELKIMELFNAMEITDEQIAIDEKSACNQHAECSCLCRKKKRHTKSLWFGEWIEGEPELKEECRFYEKQIDLIGGLFG